MMVDLGCQLDCIEKKEPRRLVRCTPGCVCVGGHFQRGFAQGKRPMINVGDTVPEAGGPE